MSSSTVPRPASTTLVVRDHAQALQVLMLRRSLSASFMPGSYVFPGGAVDTADGPELELAHRTAALRECFEECGLWLGDAAVDSDALGAVRKRMLAGKVSIRVIADELGLPLATSALALWSRWVTPIDLSKRFDTLFFVALGPAGQEALADDSETITSVWVNPAEALARHGNGSLPFEFATRCTLESLRPFDSAANLISAARRPRSIETIHPRVARTREGERCVLLPRDPGYAEVMRLDPEGTGMAVLPDLDFLKSPEEPALQRTH